MSEGTPVKDRYSHTTGSLQNIRLAGISAQEVWAVLQSSPRLTRHVSEDAAAVFGVSPAGRHVVVLVAESTSNDNDWDILNARQMHADEVVVFERHNGRTR